jgi:hypothetical protein
VHRRYIYLCCPGFFELILCFLLKGKQSSLVLLQDLQLRSNQALSLPCTHTVSTVPE